MVGGGKVNGRDHMLVDCGAKVGASLQRKGASPGPRVGPSSPETNHKFKPHISTHHPSIHLPIHSFIHLFFLIIWHSTGDKTKRYTMKFNFSSYSSLLNAEGGTVLSHLNQGNTPSSSDSHLLPPRGSSKRPVHYTWVTTARKDGKAGASHHNLSLVGCGIHLRVS